MNENFRERLSEIFPLYEETGGDELIISTKDMDEFISQGVAEYPIEGSTHVIKRGDLIYVKKENPFALNKDGNGPEEEDDSYYWQLKKKNVTTDAQGTGTGAS